MDCDTDRSSLSDYVIYVDESGDHSLTSINPEYPVFVLACCIFKKSEYINHIVPRLQSFKFEWFGHDTIVLHENEIRRAKAPFVFLADDDKRSQFMEQLADIVMNAPMTIIACLIAKQNLIKHYSNPENPYDLALMFCLERAQTFLRRLGQSGRVTHIIVEARSPRRNSMGKEDKDLADAFRRIVSAEHPLSGRRPLTGFELIFADKKINSSGLQLADLVARPIGVNHINPNQPNRAFDIIKDKLSLKTFPKSERPRGEPRP